GLLDEPFRIARSARQKAHVHEIETFATETRRVSIALTKFQVRRRARAGVLKEIRIPVEPDHAPVWPHALRQRCGDATRPAAEIDARPSGAHADEIEHDLGIACERRALEVQALDL